MTRKTRTIKGTSFTEGQLVVAYGVDFTLVHIGKRSLILRPGFSPLPRPSSEPCDARPAADSAVEGGATKNQNTGGKNADL